MTQTLRLPNAINKYTQLMPEMGPTEREELKKDIRHKGVLQAILVDDSTDDILDGRHRWTLWAELINEGVDLPMPDLIRRRFSSEEDKIDVVLSCNAKRRHLTPEQRTEVVLKLRLEYGYTMQKIAEMLTVNIATISRDLASLPDEDRTALAKAVVISANGKQFAGDGYAPRIMYVPGNVALANAQNVVRGNESSETRADQLEALLEKYKVETGQVWYIPSKNSPGDVHRLVCGDTLKSETYDLLFSNGSPDIKAGKARLVITSPPYNQNLDGYHASGKDGQLSTFAARMRDAYSDNKPEDEYRAEQIQMFNVTLAHTTEDAGFFYNHKNRVRDRVISSPQEWLRLQVGWKLRQEIIWDKSSGMGVNSRMFALADERIYWLVKDPTNFYFVDTAEVSNWTTIWKFAAKNEADFSAPFSNELPRRCIMACSELRDIVLDPYSGTGTTITECERLSRIGYGIEISPEYVAGQLGRFAQMGLEPTLAPF